MSIIPGEIVGCIKISPSIGPLFKEELKDIKKNTPEDHIKIIKETFETIAKTAMGKLNSDFSKLHISRQLRESFYNAIARQQDISQDEVKKKIEDFVKVYPEKVINVARDIAHQVFEHNGIDILKNTTQKELLDLVGSPTLSIITYLLREQPSLLNRHLANFILAKIASELFKTNIILRDVEINFNYAFGGTVVETWRLEAIISKDMPSINFIQGIASMAPGFGEGELQCYHIQPQEIV